MKFNSIVLYNTYIIFDIFRSIKYNSLVCICNNKHIIKNIDNMNIFDIKIKSVNKQYDIEFIKLNDYELYEDHNKNIRKTLYDGYDIEICFIKEFPESVNNVNIELGNFSINVDLEPLDTRFHNKKCISTIQKNETHLIESWIDYYSRLGFEYFFIYDNNFNIDNYKDLLLKYKEKIIIHDIQFPYMVNTTYGSRPVGQFIELNHCLWKFTPEFLGLFDLDEYIYLRKDITLFDKDISVLSFPNFWFGCNNNAEYTFKNFIYKLFKREINIETFSQRKIIIQSKNVDLTCVHNALNLAGEYRRLTHDEGYLRHYLILSEKQRKCNCNVYCNVEDKL